MMESKEPGGNYVSINNTTKLPDMKLEQLFGGSHVCDFSDQHVTLIYSKTTSVTLSQVAKVIATFPSKIEADVVGVDAFDSTPKDDGNRSIEECTIVLKLKSDELTKVHKKLKAVGLEHSYDEFSPHISLLYDIPIDQKKKALDTVGKFIHEKNIKVTLSGYNNNKIIKDWHKKAKE